MSLPQHTNQVTVFTMIFQSHLLKCTSIPSLALLNEINCIYDISISFVKIYSCTAKRDMEQQDARAVSNAGVCLNARTKIRLPPLH